MRDVDAVLEQAIEKSFVVCEAQFEVDE